MEAVGLLPRADVREPSSSPSDAMEYNCCQQSHPPTPGDFVGLPAQPMQVHWRVVSIWCTTGVGRMPYAARGNIWQPTRTGMSHCRGPKKKQVSEPSRERARERGRGREREKQRGRERQNSCFSVANHYWVVLFKMNGTGHGIPIINLDFLPIEIIWQR